MGDHMTPPFTSDILTQPFRENASPEAAAGCCAYSEEKAEVKSGFLAHVSQTQWKTDSLLVNRCVCLRYYHPGCLTLSESQPLSKLVDKTSKHASGISVHYLAS